MPYCAGKMLVHSAGYSARDSKNYPCLHLAKVRYIYIYIYYKIPGLNIPVICVVTSVIIATEQPFTLLL